MDCIVESDGARISYSVDGPLGRPTLLFINSIGTTRDLWSAQVPALVGTYRVIRYDARGHGSSSVPAGNYSIEQLARDALAILDAEDVKQAHICGISLGGLTAMWLGVHAADRVSSLVLANTAARIGSVQSWTDRIALVQQQGMRGVAERRNADVVLAGLPSTAPGRRSALQDDGRDVPDDGIPGMLRGAAG